MERNFTWEANSCSVIHEIFHILQKSSIYYSVHNSLLMVSLLSQMNPLDAILFCSVNIIPSVARFSKWSLSFTYTYQNILWIFQSFVLATCPAPSHPPNNIWSWVQIMKLIIKFLQFPVIFCSLGPNNLLCIVFSKTLSLCSLLDMRNRVSHPSETPAKLPCFTFCFSYCIADRKSKYYNPKGSKQVPNSEWFVLFTTVRRLLYIWHNISHFYISI
jgi:hypothetical protein